MDTLTSWLEWLDIGNLLAMLITLAAGLVTWILIFVTHRQRRRHQASRKIKPGKLELRVENHVRKSKVREERSSQELIGEIRNLIEDAMRSGTVENIKGVFGADDEEVEQLVLPPNPHEYRVWFGTDRQPADPSDISKGFSARRGRMVHYGCCDVQVPESHKIGSVGSSALHRLLRWTDDRLRMRRTTGIEPDRFWQAVARQLAELGLGRRNAVIFIHGYNVSFDEAAIRAAQLGFDLGVGTMAFFSWPSKGRKTRRAYQSDGQTISASENAIANFLVDFASRSGADSVHLIVHSMGNQGVLRAVNRIIADAERRRGCRFGQIILAAADVDADTFGSLAAAYRELAARTTLYISQRDLALKASAWFADYPRVGLYPPVSVFDGIDTVSVSNIDLTLLGHGYVGEARDVLHDMHRLIFDGTPPPRFGLKPRRNDDGKTYWEVGA